MKSILKKAVAISAIALIAGCSESGSVGDDQTAAFGAATANNTLAQGVNLSYGQLVDLQSRFRAAAPDMINFAFDSADLDDEARAILTQQAAWIKSNPSIKLRVYGHTDLVGSAGYNRGLGLRRARAAVNYLVASGVRRGQVEAVASFGETRPLVATQNRERLNRRTVTEVAGLDKRFRPYDFDGKVANNIYGNYVANSGGGAPQGGAAAPAQ